MGAEYIEKQALIDATDDRYSLGEIGRLERDIIVDAVTYAKPADVKPVVRGEWSVAIGYDPKRSFLCSVCQRMNYEPSNFCPNCNADMRGDDAE